MEEPREKLPMMVILRRRLAHHEAKAGKIRESINLLEDNPDLERIYNLLQESKG